MYHKCKILICPLDWGLGHATRCIPIIHSLLRKNYDVIIAGNEVSNAILQDEFPTLHFIYIEGYNVRYSKKKWALPFVLFRQLPRLILAIKKEHTVLDKLVDTYKVDVVVSDNRYGFYSNKCMSIFITHQLQILVPNSVYLQKIVNKINYFFIKNFDKIWVPDYDNNEMAGKLSQNIFDIKNIEYIGNLSRFEFQETTQKKYDILILLSGPEPQRSILEEKLHKQILHLNKKILIVRGKPNTDVMGLSSENKFIEIKNHLTKIELQAAILESEIVICRSGYTTVMDLIKLQKHAILIPTPGQTEQEYLAKYLSEKRWFIYTTQQKLNIENILNLYETTIFDSFFEIKDSYENNNLFDIENLKMFKK